MKRPRQGYARRSRKLAFESLEPRALLSADLLPVAALPEPAPPLPAEFRDASAFAPAAAVVQLGAESPRELVIVDAAIDGAADLAGEWAARGFEVVVLDPSRDALDQIGALLGDRRGLAAVHLVSHGTQGSLQLGGTTLGAAELSARAVEVARWADAFAADGDLLLYGCEVADGDAGRAFVERLALLTGADVAASVDATGAALLGGDWDLERVLGAIDAASLPPVTGWIGLLVTDTLDWDAVALAGQWPDSSLGANSMTTTLGGTVTGTLTGDIGYLAPFDGSGTALTPVVSTRVNGGTFQNTLQLQADGFDNVQSVTLTLDFSAFAFGVSNLSFTIFDVDSGGFIDRLTVTSDRGNPTALTPSLYNVVVGANAIVGNNTGNSSNDAPDGNAGFSFAGVAGIRLLTINYGNDGGPTGQGIGIHDITFDPTPGASDRTVSTPEDQTYTFAGSDFGFTDYGGDALQTVRITGLPTAGALRLSGVAVTLGQDIAASDIGLGRLTFQPVADASGAPHATFRFRVGDGTSLSVADYQMAVNVTAVNDAPVNAVPGAQATNEDTALVFSAGNGNRISIADVDAGTSLVDVALTVTNGTLTLAGTSGLSFQAGANGSATMTVRGTVADINAAMNGMSFAPTADYNGAASLTIVTNDRGFSGSGGARSDTDLVAITVNAVNDAPVLGSLAGDARSYAAGAGAVVVDQGTAATVTDIDSPDFAGGSLTVAITAGRDAAEDVLAINVGAVTLSAGMTVGSTVSVGGIAIGTIAADGIGANDLVVSFNASATPARVETLVRAITYQDTDAIAPTPGGRNIRFTLNDGDGGTSAAANATITVKPVVAIAATDATAAEPADNGRFTVTLSAASATDTVVSYSIGGTAANGSDYALLSGSVTVLAGSTSAFIDVTASNDTLVEPTETVVVTLTGVTAGDGDIRIRGDANSASVSIADNDTALVAIAATTAGAEPGTNGQFTVSMTNASSTNTVLTYTVTGTAVAGSDYTALSGTVTILAGATTATINVPVLNDSVVEATETVIVTLSAISSGDPDISINGGANAATVNITDDDTTLVSIAATAAGAEPGTNGQFTVSMTNASSTNTVLTYTIAGTAVAGSDYTALSGTVTILAGATTATIDVPVLNDSIVEATETVIVTLSAITSGDPDISINGAGNAATVNITDEDTALVSIVATSAGAEPGTNGQFTVWMTNASSTNTVLTYTIAGTAVAGSDYTALSGTVTILAGATTATINVPVLNDSIVEATETVIVTLSAITSGDADIGINGGADSATVNITDEDTALVSIAATDPTAAEPGNGGRFTVTLTSAASTDTVIAYAIGGTAAAGSDYTALSGTVTVLAGSTTAFIDVTVLNELLVEGDETVIVTLAGITAGDPDIAIDGAAATATVTIADDDSAQASVAGTVNGAEPGSAGRFTVSLTQASSTDTVVTYTVGGTAASSTDYVALAGSVTIAAGGTTAFIDVSALDDLLLEANETVVLTLAAIASGDPDVSLAPGGASAGIAILDNDTALVSIAPTGAAAEPGTPGQFTVSMSAASSTDTVVAYTIGGSALAGSDYAALSGTVTILAGATTATIDVPVLNDSIVETTETVVLTLAGLAGDPDIAIDGAASSATVNITDDDTATVSVAATTPNAAEPGTNGRFTVSMTNASSTDTVVSYAIGGTASNGVDYALLSGSVTLAAGSTSAVIDVAVLNDLLLEADETVTVTLLAIASGDPDVTIAAGASAAAATLADDDAALVSIAATAAGAEPGAGGQFTVSMTNASSTDTVLAYTIAGTALAGADYTALSGTVTIIAGATTATINVPVLNDVIVEATETVVVTLSAISAGDPQVSINGAASAATVNIADDDAALAAIAATDPAAGEPGNGGRFTITLTDVSSTDTVIAYAVGGTAAAGSDYTAMSGTVTILAGTTTAFIDVSVLDELLVEGNETVIVTLASVSAGDPDIAIDGAASSATVNLADDDTATVSIAASTPSAAEPGAGGQFTVSMTNASSTDTVLTYAIAGTALAGTDYTALSGTVTILAGSTTATINVAVLDDAIVEATEAVIVTLSAISAGDPDVSINGAANQATVSIADDDAALVSIGATVAGAEPGTGGQFTVSMTNASSTDTVLAYTIAGTALAGADYTALSGTVTILAGATTATINVPVLNDAIVEATETVVVRLSAVSAGDPDISIDGAANQATVNIADDDTALVSIAATAAGVEPGAGGQFTVSMTNASSTDTVLTYTIAGTALAGTDYTVLSGTVTILAGATTATIDVPVLNDAIVEATETVIVTLSAISAGDPDVSVDGAANQATVSIADDDTALVSVAASTPNAAEPGANGQFTVSMTNASSTDTVLTYAIAGTALAGADYTALSGTVTILAGATTATINVPVLNDSIVEAAETVIVTLSAISAGDPDIAIDGAASSATVSIADDDTALASIAATAAGAEPGTGGQFTVSMTNASSTDTVLAYTIAGTALAGADYTALSGTVTIIAGATTATINVPVLNDAIVEATETVVVTLSSISAGDPQVSIDGAASSATVTIADDDSALAAVAATAPAGEPGVNGRFTVTLTNVSSTDTVLTYTVAGTAAGGTDYVALPGSVTLLAGAASADIDLTVLDDALDEPVETVVVTLTVVASGDPDIAIDGAAAVASVALADDDETPTLANATIALPENSPLATLAIDLADAVTGTDADPDGDPIIYTIIGGNGAGAFAIDPATGRLTVANPAPLDFETTPSFVLTVQASDGTNTGNATLTLNLVNVNEAPTATLPASRTVAEDTVMTFSSAGGNVITVADVDAATLRVTLAATNGALTLGSLAGLAFTTGDGVGDPNLTFTGTIAAINAALDGLAYLPAADYNGGASISMLLEDLGQSGSGGPQSAAASVAVTVTPVNDAPTIAGDLALLVLEGQSVTVLSADLLGVDVDDAGTGLVFEVIAAPGRGRVELADAPGIALASFTQADLDAGRVRYVHDGSETTADAFSLRLSDGGEDGASPDVGTLNVVIVPVNDAPVLATGNGNVDEGTRIVLNAALVSATDPDNATGTLLFSLDTIIGGFVELADSPGVPITRFTGAQLESGLVRFVQADAAVAPAFRVTVSDGQATDGPRVVVLTLRGTGGLPQDASPRDTAPGMLTAAAFRDDTRLAEVRAPQAVAFLREPRLVIAGPTLAEPEPSMPTAVSTRLAGAALQTPPVEVAAAGLRFVPPAPGEVTVPRIDFSFDPGRYDLESPEGGAPLGLAAIDAVRVAGLALTAGGVWWVFRMGSLIGSALVSAPAWRHIDPLPVLGGGSRENVEWDAPDEPSPDAETDASEQYFNSENAANSPRG